MSVTLHPRVAPSDRLRLWIGAFDRTTPPSPTWTLDGHARTPRARRPIVSVRGPTLLADNPPRTFAGVYEFVNHFPDTPYRVTVKADQKEASLTTRARPAQVPACLDTWFN